jgi:hypothetical protein
VNVLVRTIAAIALMFCSLAYAHKPSDSYLTIGAEADHAQLTAQWDIALRDLEHAVGVDVDGDGAITWGELRQRERDIEQYASAHLSITSVDGDRRDPCAIDFGQVRVDEHVDGAYAVLSFHAACATPPAQLAIRYSLLFDVDPTHRGLLDLRTPSGSQTIVFSQGEPEFIAEMTRAQPWMQAVRSFVQEGVSHILHGYDHVLFLITLLLPAVVLYRNGGWEPLTSLRDAMLDVVKVVTAFTLAHSFTLSAGALGWLSLPSRLVESAIAFTVVLGALNNLYPIVTRRRWLAALLFGLIHGFGFASVLTDLGLQRSDLALALFSFNLGVELGQLAIVVVLVPVAYCIRASLFYRRVFMPVGAVLIAALAGFWFVERAFVITVS